MSEAPSPAPTRPPELTVDRAYLRALTAALVETLGPKKGRRLLQAMAQAIAAEVERSDVIPIRCERERRERETAAKIQAAAAFRADLPMLVRAFG